MKYSISNIGWPINSNLEVYKLMKKYGYSGLEIAPGKVANNLYSINVDEKNNFFNIIKPFDIAPIAMQSLLFGTQGMNLFEDDISRNKLLVYLKTAIDWANFWGVEALVFGSPKNRVMADPNNITDLNNAYIFFKTLGDFAYSRGVRFCIEPNPKEYETNFLNTTDEALNFVLKVNSLGLRVNLDLGTIILNNEIINNVVNKSTLPLIGHIHISEPYLTTIRKRKESNELINLLNKLNYPYWVSIEMKEVPELGVSRIEKVLKLIKKD